MIRCVSCARSGSRTSSAFAWSRRRNASSGSRRASSRNRLASGRSPSSSGSRSTATVEPTSSALLAPLDGSSAGLDRPALVDRPAFRLVAVFGEALRRFPVSNETKRYAQKLLRAERPEDASPRAIHRFRRATEPWAVDALVFVGRPELQPELQAAREREPAEPLLRGDELGLPPGPEIGRLLERDRRGTRRGHDLDPRRGARARRARAIEEADGMSKVGTIPFPTRANFPSRLAVGRRLVVPV